MIERERARERARERDRERPGSAGGASIWHQLGVNKMNKRNCTKHEERRRSVGERIFI